MIRVGFSGTRHGMSTEQRTAVGRIFMGLPASWLLHGGCVGADEEAHVIAGTLGLKRAVMPSTLKNYQMREELRRAADWVAPPDEPLNRNRFIVDNAHMLVAAPNTVDAPRSGTWATIRYARSVDLPSIVVGPGGRIL